MTEALDAATARQNRVVAQAVRNLATQIGKVSAQQRASQTRKATVVAVNYNKTTGVVTADLNLSGDTTVVVPAVNVVQGVSPNVGDTVNVLKQDATMSVVSQIGTATGGGWITPSLASGFSHNGDGEGNLQYRIVNDNGSLKVEWLGAVAITGTPTSVLATALDTMYRPSATRKVVAARGMGNGNSLPFIQVVFNTNGTVTLAGGAYSSASIALGTSGASGDVHDHSHGGSVLEVSFIETHTHALGTATLAYSAPDWVSFNGLYYYL